MSVATTASHDAAPTDRRRSLALPGRVVAWLGGVLALAIAGALFTRFGIDVWVRRD
jgi:hypothetical protein